MVVTLKTMIPLSYDLDNPLKYFHTLKLSLSLYDRMSDQAQWVTWGAAIISDCRSHLEYSPRA